MYNLIFLKYTATTAEKQAIGALAAQMPPLPASYLRLPAPCLRPPASCYCPLLLPTAYCYCLLPPATTYYLLPTAPAPLRQEVKRAYPVCTALWNALCPSTSITYYRLSEPIGLRRIVGQITKLNLLPNCFSCRTSSHNSPQLPTISHNSNTPSPQPVTAKSCTESIWSGILSETKRKSTHWDLMPRTYLLNLYNRHSKPHKS